MIQSLTAAEIHWNGPGAASAADAWNMLKSFYRPYRFLSWGRAYAEIDESHGAQDTSIRYLDKLDY